MKAYDISNKTYNKIITPLLKRKRLDVITSTAHVNNPTSFHDSRSGLKGRITPGKESHSYTSLHQFTNKDYYNQRRVNLQQNTNPIQLRKQKIIENLEQFDQIDSNSHIFNDYFQEKGLYYNKEYGIDDFLKIKNERDEALKEITALKEINKGLSCDYSDAIMQLKDYEKMNNDLEDRIQFIERKTMELDECKAANNQLKTVINDYQEQLNKMTIQIENLSNDNLQLENTNSLLINDVNEAKKIISKLKSSQHHHDKEERKNTPLKPSNQSSKTNISKKVPDSPIEKRIISYEQAKRLKKNISNSTNSSIIIMTTKTTPVLIEELEKESNDMNNKVNDIEQQLDEYIYSNNIRINTNNNQEDNNSNNNDVLFTITQSLCLFINEINGLLNKDQISFAQYFNKTQSLEELANSLDKIKQTIMLYNVKINK